MQPGWSPWFTELMDPAWIGLTGVVVGALIGYPVQALLAKRADAAARSKDLRADRVAAYSSFAEKVMDWRRWSSDGC